MYCWFSFFLHQGNGRGERGVHKEHPTALILSEKEGKWILHSEN